LISGVADILFILRLGYNLAGTGAKASENGMWLILLEKIAADERGWLSAVMGLWVWGQTAFFALESPDRIGLRLAKKVVSPRLRVFGPTSDDANGSRSRSSDRQEALYLRIIREAALRRILFFSLLSVALAGDGRTPRSSSADYPAHQETTAAEIGAVRVSPEQLNKNFPSDFSKKYVVVEVAIYPKAGAVDVVDMDFVLRLTDSESHPDTAEEVAGLWRPRNRAHPDVTSGTHVSNETGIIMASQTDPVTGRRVNSTGTYERVGVSGGDDPNRPIQYPTGASNADADRMEAQLTKWALPEGKTNSPVAGYVYFPASAKKSKGTLELQYSHDGSSASLKLPAPSK
jgi:hypothetical protein